jgi:KUP system potassium uptake protein
VPFTNWTLYFAVVALVLGFKSSSNLAAAYGIVTGTMLIDTILVAFVMVLLWRWHPLVVALVAGASCWWTSPSSPPTSSRSPKAAGSRS